ncbi:hypothetical protein [Bradyrhizobium sp. AC87j1]|uniref:hypothetical protein n=1 Tax=Bradyrhizobium sp. AC87j1 TaxID=2055894 RepID=UPI00191BE1F2|nr:hypothetical protein [Bradyrhizobium sp. AC87j1]
MNETTNVFPLLQPDQIADPLTDILRAGARELIARAVENEFTTFLETTNIWRCRMVGDRRAKLPPASALP